MPAFTVEAQPVAPEVYPGQNATFDLHVSNPALLLDRQARMSVVSQLPADWTYGFSVDPLPVARNSTNTTRLAIYVPSTAQPQVLPVTVEARDDWNFTRVQVNVTVKERPASEPGTLPPPRLTLSISTGDSGESGDEVEGTLIVQNHDAQRPSVSVQIAPVRNGDWVPYVHEADRNRVLSPGESVSIPVRVVVPPLASNATGEMEITVATDGITYAARWVVLGIAPQADDATGSSTTDGVATTDGSGSATGSRPPFRAPGPNLDILVAPVEAHVASGGATDVTVRLNNSGSTSLRVTLVGTPPSQWAPFVFETTEPVSLAPGEAAEVSLTLRAPEGIPPGGTADAKVTAVTDETLVRTATFLIRVTESAPRDETSAATIEAPTAPEGGLPVSGPTALVAVGLAGAGVGAAIMLNRPLRETLLWGAAGLYTRLARPDVLGHEDRERLYRLVETTPGIHFHALQRDLGWNTGTLTYHLRVLERHGFVVSRRDGLYRRFYLSGAAPRKEVFENQGPSGLRADVLDAIRNTPGISQSDLALGLGANKQTVNYHVKALERAGTIRVEKRGRDTFLYPNDAPQQPGPGLART